MELDHVRVHCRALLLVHLNLNILLPEIKRIVFLDFIHRLVSQEQTKLKI
jgi:hypothetical protein